MSDTNLEERIAMAREKSNGLTVFLEITIKNCYQYSIEFERQRKDPRRFRQMMEINQITYYPKDGSSLKIDHYDSEHTLSRVVDGKHNYFDIQLKGIACTNMDFNPNLEFTVRNSPWSRVIPALTVEAEVYNETTGKFERYVPFKGSVDQFDKVIDIVQRA